MSRIRRRKRPDVEYIANEEAYEFAEYDQPVRRRRSGSKRSRSASSGPQLWFRRIGLALLALLLVIVLYKIGRMGYLAFQLTQRVTNIERLAESSLSTNVASILAELQGIEVTLNAIGREIAPLQPSLNYLDGMTKVGTTIAHAGELTDLGEELTRMAIQGLAISGPVLQERQSGSFPTALANLVEDSTQGINDLRLQADALIPQVEALGQLDLLSSLAEPLREGGATMGFGSAMLQLAPSLPALMGTAEPVTYLILIQNNHELRATGGLISAVGQLTLDNGEIVALEFKDSYDILNHDVEHPWAPEPMQRFLGVELMFFRDTNWSPDLPTAGQLIRTIYQQNEGVKADGIITIDLHAVELLMAGFGQLRVPDVVQPITSENIVEQIKLFWQQAPTLDDSTQSQAANEATSDEQDWWKHRKDFMPFLGEATIRKLQTGSADYLTLVQALYNALEERSVQIWVDDPTAAGQLAELGWDGSLRSPAEGDFLALVDSNFGFNKVDSVLERHLHYTVEWPDGQTGSSASGNQPAIATASIVYEHPVAVAGHQCDITPRYGTTYDDMSARCYFDYVRLYVPLGSQLRDVAGVDLTTTDSRPGENGTQVFSAYFIAKPGDEQTVQFQYELPSRIQQDDYQLTVRRQSGTKPLDFNATIGVNSRNPIIIKSEIQKNSYHWP